MGRGYAVENPASSEFIERETIKGTEIGIFTPSETKQLLYAVEDSLKPAMALWCFSGVRIAEIARLSCDQVRQGLKSGSIYLGAGTTKTKDARSVEICGNLRQWLERYLPMTGPVMPEQWQTISGLSELSRHVARRTRIAWKKNAPRHTFATMSLALFKDAPALVKQMGTSLAKLERHYWARAASVTVEDAKEYFAIMPADAANVVPLHNGLGGIGKDRKVESATDSSSCRVGRAFGN